MNEFQILDKDGNAQKLQDIDLIASELWGKENDGTSWASPAIRREGEKEFHFISREMTANWFDQLGWAIANQGDYYEKNSWKNVAHYLFTIHDAFFSQNEETKEIKVEDFEVVNYSSKTMNDVKMTPKLTIAIYSKIEFAKPYINLINKLNSLGYTPKQIIK